MLRVYPSNTIELILEFALIFMIFILVIFSLDLCGVILTRKLSKFAGSSFTIKRSIVVFISNIIGRGCFSHRWLAVLFDYCCIDSSNKRSFVGHPQ